jgi:dolichyl-phosphate beta-glucosyltransferase
MPRYGQDARTTIRRRRSRLRYGWANFEGRKPMTRSETARNRAETAVQATAGVLPPRPADHDFSLVIPAYNEEGRLPWTLAELNRFLDASGIDYRVLVADDGSTDRTPTLAENVGPRFSTVSLPKNRGKGAAVRNAMLRATGKVLAFTDADLPFELESLHQAYDLVRTGRCEVVFGARDLAQSTHRAKRKLTRTLATWLFREVVKRLISREVTDTQCGLKAFSQRAAHAIFSRLTLDGFSFDAEVVFLTQRLGLAFQRIPVNLVREYGSTLSLRRHTMPMLGDIVGLWWRNRHLEALPLELPRTVPVAEQDRHKAA